MQGVRHVQNDGAVPGARGLPRPRQRERFFLGTDTSVLVDESESLPIEIVSASESKFSGGRLISEPVGVAKPSGRDLSQVVCRSCRSSAVSNYVAGLAPSGITPREQMGEGWGPR